jgi:stage II sporulation protein D
VSSIRTRHLWISSGILLLTCGLHAAAAKPIYPKSNEPPSEIQAGTSAQMWADWLDALAPLATPTAPDRSYRNIWVRIFPLVSNPLGDPYPNTEDYAHISFGNSGGMHLYDLNDQHLIAAGKNVAVDFGTQMLTVDGNTYPVDPYWLVPDNKAITTTVTWDHGSVRTEMRGGFVFKKSVHIPRDNPVPRELWSAINVVAVNDYLQSVVPSEVISSWNTQTLKAQAIAARTYGLFEAASARAEGLDFDVDPSTWFQSYQGAKFWDRSQGAWRTVELGATNHAVTSSGGEVILYQNEVIKAYFSANSGGRTCLASECLELDSNPPYIQSIDDHPQIRGQPGGTWGSRATLTPDAIRTVLLNVGVSPPAAVRKLEALEKGPSGRTWRLRVDWADGSTLDLDRDQTRKIMHLYGPIRSFLYNLGTVSGGKQGIQGWGYGHAVGMSQWGAQLYARDGWDAHRILQHYYKSVVIKDLSAP